MKKLGIALIAFCSMQTSFAQKVITEKVEVKETRLPLAPLPDVEHYQFTVSTPYAVNNDDIIESAKRRHEEALANHPAKVEEAKRQYEQDLANYDYDVEMARENFKIETDAFNKMSTVERLALSDQKPKLNLPRKPYYSEPREPVYTEPNTSTTLVFDPIALADINLRLDGFTKGEEQALVGTVKIYDFQSQEPVQKSIEKSYYNTNTKKTEKKTVYSYETNVKRPTHLHLEANGQELYNGIFETTEDYKVLKTDTRPNLFTVEKESVEEVLVEINDYINSNYGYSEMIREMELSYVKNKDGEYDDVEDGYSYSKAGLEKFSYKDLDENSDLIQGISMFEAALSEADFNDKKARIDEKVGQALLFNLANIYLATYDIAKAKQKIDALKDLKLNFQEKQALEALENLYNDRKARAEANGL